MSAESNGRVQFGDFELDSHSGKLLRHGWPVKIQPQPLRVLRALLEQPGAIVSREQLRARIWGDATFVEFDQGLNYCIRQIRLALRDGAMRPLYIETLPRQGYRFIAQVNPVSNGTGASIPASDPSTEALAESATVALADISPVLSLTPQRKRFNWAVGIAGCAILVIAGVILYRLIRTRPVTLTFTQLTDFTDSAVAPALSRDGHMLAFIRGSQSFLSPDQIYIKLLPNGETRLLTEDAREKYGLAFSYDGSVVAYTVLAAAGFLTYTVPALGGEPRVFLNNAAGLTRLDSHQLLFSRMRPGGVHMGIVAGTAERQDFRELYFPPHERAMAHYSFASPDRKFALVVQMDEQGIWTPCRLVALTRSGSPRLVGPNGACGSAGWSADGSWMYFTAYMEGRSHLWRQRFPDGPPEQLTFGATDEDGIAMEPNGNSLITSMGVEESSIWIHDAHGDRSLSSEGQIVDYLIQPFFGADGKTLYYLLSRNSGGSELWRMDVSSGRSEAVLPGISMHSFDISPDQTQVVYATGTPHHFALWIAPLDRRSPPRQIGNSGEIFPRFGPRGRVIFQIAEGGQNYLEQMNQDGSNRAKVVSYPIADLQGISPSRRWISAAIPDAGEKRPAIVLIPAEGGSPRVISFSYCLPAWSPDGKFLYVPVENATRDGPGRSLAIPISPGETLPTFPPGGIPPRADAGIVPGARSVNRVGLIPANDPSQFAFINKTVHHNLYRISMR